MDGVKFTHIDRVVVNCKQNYCNDCQIKCKTQTEIQFARGLFVFSCSCSCCCWCCGSHAKLRYLCIEEIEEDLALILFIVTKSLPFASCGCCCCCCLFISACLTLKIIYKLFNTIYKLLPQTTRGLEGERRRGTLLRHHLQSSHSFIANWFSFCAAHYECNCDDADVAAAFNCRPKMVKVIHVAAAERDGERVRASASEMAAKDAADWSVCNMLEQPQCCGNNATLF